MLAKTKLFMLVMVLTMFSNAVAQDSTREKQRVAKSNYDALPPRQLIDCPTAATLPRASFDVHVRDFSGGGLLTSINIGLHQQFMIGVSYGGEGVLGESKATWQDHPEFEVKYQFIPETYTFPAVALGFTSQGYGRYLKDWERFTYKSKGFYAVVSKAYQTYEWATGFHGGINYSLEHTKDDDQNPDFFFGFDMNINHNVAIVAEYNIALNDDKKHEEKEFGGRGRGYFNIGLRWIFYERLELGFDFKNLFDNRRDVNQVSRELRMSYYEFF